MSRPSIYEAPAGYSRNPGGHSGMLTIHSAQDAPDEWRDRFEACFVQGMEDARLPADSDLSKAMREYIHRATREVSRHSPVGSTVQPGLPMPRLSWDGLEQ